MSRAHPRIRVKLINRGQAGHLWARQTPGDAGVWGDCEFIFARDADAYDWLVVIDDVSRSYTAAPETLACADSHTLLVTTEPPTITRYGRAFSRQFAHVLTSQDPAALPHPHRIHAQTGNLWFNGYHFDHLASSTPPEKSRPLSTVCSSKRQQHTLHNVRLEFTRWLQGKLPAMDLFGHGTRPIEHKYDALDPYRFHLAIENHLAPHHWTEKLADPYLSHTIPIYCGCPNIADYFPAESYVAIDIRRPAEALDIIQAVLADPAAYQNRADALREARRRLLYQYNLIAVVENFIGRHYQPDQPASRRPLYGRKQMRLRHPGDMISHILWSTRKPPAQPTHE
jgi:hypothetical protein